MAQSQNRMWKFFGAQRSRLLGLVRQLERTFSPQDPLVAIIRREGVIRDGRYIMYFEVTLFGDNPVVLEEFGHVMNREKVPAPVFREELADVVKDYRYFIEIRQRFDSIEEARDFWVVRGATCFWHD